MKHVVFPYIEYLARWFAFSSARTSRLREMCKDLNEEQIVLVINGFTRWLTQDDASESLELGFGPVVLVLRDDPDPTAQGLYRYLCTKEFVQCLLMLRDTLPHLATLSRIFQPNKLMPSLPRLHLRMCTLCSLVMSTTPAQSGILLILLSIILNAIFLPSLWLPFNFRFLEKASRMYERPSHTYERLFLKIGS